MIRVAKRHLNAFLRRPDATSTASAGSGGTATSRKFPANSNGSSTQAFTARETNTREFAGVRFALETVESTADLTQIVFVAVINERVRLAQHLFARVAIAQISAGAKRVILLVDKQKLSADDIHAVLELLSIHGYELPQDGPQAYDITPEIVISLSQGHLDPNRTDAGITTISDKTTSSLLGSFLEIAKWAVVNNAADIDFAIEKAAPSSQICFKIDGKYIRPERFRIPTKTAEQMIGMLWQKSGGGAESSFEKISEQQAEATLDLPRSSDIPNGARIGLRWSSMAYDKGVVITLRIHRLDESAQVRSLDSAGYSPPQIAIFERTNRSEGGLIVFSGPVGSGKSTTVAQLINLLADDMKIVAFEDPVELRLRNAYQKTIRRSLLSTGADPGFLAATRSLFRSALDALLLGEIRDEVTALIARQIVESGHTVYTTVHARSALGIIARLVSLGIPLDVLATPGNLKLLVFQTLLRTNCPHCALSPDEHAHEFLDVAQRAKQDQYFARINRLFGLDRDQFRLRNHIGCPHCQRPELAELNGYAGRTTVAEMVEPTDDLLSHILSGNNLELEREWRLRASSDFSKPHVEGRTAMEDAIYKAGLGLIDPREIEPRFESFETMEIKRNRARAHQPSRPPEPHGLRAVAGG